jgi:hypothetical protein
MSEKKLREELNESFKHRAILYYLIYDEMRKELGAARAEAILGRAIYRRGAQKGKPKYGPFAPSDLAGVRKTFLVTSADGGRMFQPEVVHENAETLDIVHHKCPLKDAWLEMGLPETEVATMCRIAARVDNGTFEAAGFRFSAETWQPGGERCCVLHIRRGTAEK